MKYQRLIFISNWVQACWNIFSVHNRSLSMLIEVFWVVMPCVRGSVVTTWKATYHNPENSQQTTISSLLWKHHISEIFPLLNFSNLRNRVLYAVFSEKASFTTLKVSKCLSFPQKICLVWNMTLCTSDVL